MERALSVINLEQVIKMCLLLLLHLGTTQAEEFPLAQISASNAAPALSAASAAVPVAPVPAAVPVAPIPAAVPVAPVPGAVPVAPVLAAVPVAPVPAAVPVAPVASQTSPVPAAPAIIPASPATVPVAPSAIPPSSATVQAAPAVIPASPAAVPAAPSAIPASPAAVPAAPAAIPASPAAVAGSPAVIPASPAAVPASPTVLPALSAALPSSSAALPVAPASPTTLIATSAVLPAAPSALPNDSSVLPVVPALLPTDSAPRSVASNTSSAAPNPAESSVPPGDPFTPLPAVILSATSDNVSISPALAKDPASPTVDPQIVAPPKPVNNETSDVGDDIHTLINATTAIKNSVFSHVDSIKENINDGKENKDLVKVTSIQDSAISPQTQIYIVAGCLGGVVFILILLILALALSVSKIKDQLSASNRYSPSTSNPQARGGDIFAYDNGAYNSREAQDRRQGEAEMQERVAEGNDDLEKMGYSVYNGRQDNPPNRLRKYSSCSTIQLDDIQPI